jgi:hypothetical protein
MKTKTFILISFFFVKLCYSQNNEKLLIGKWTPQADSSVGYIECASVIKIEPTKKYEVFNDCYGFNPKNPVIEEGIWSYNPKEKKLTFYNRIFKVKGIGGEDKMEYNVLELTGNSLKVDYVSEDGIVIVTFKK